MTEDVFHICQAATKEVVEVSKYYLDRRPLSHTLNLCLPVQHHFKPPQDSDSIEIGDFIEVLDGEYTGKHGIIDWLSKNDSKLWFQDIFTSADTESRLSSISVPKAMVQRMDLTQTIQYTKERGYDVKPRDTINVQIGFVTKLQNVSLDSFKKEIDQEVFVIGGDWKGYRATLYSLSTETCNIAVHGQQCTTVKLHDIVTRYGMRLTGPIPSLSNGWTTWSASPGDVDVAHNPASDINPSSSTSAPWAIDSQDHIDAEAEKLSDSGLLPWLMTNKFASKFLSYHVVLKVSPSFMGGRLNKRFVSTACPDLFCASCYAKDSKVKIVITPTVTVTLHFNQICLVEPSQTMSRVKSAEGPLSSIEIYHAIKLSGNLLLFSSKNPHDCPALISSGFDNSIMAYQCSAVHYQNLLFLCNAWITVSPNTKNPLW
ncbi:hypothetical protein EDD22DRAFT_848660 [Suillus occidentalis]|nr:hypothetical protein EDD22DRAFT_848660 [Suillus occidentalis]